MYQDVQYVALSLLAGSSRAACSLSACNHAAAVMECEVWRLESGADTYWYRCRYVTPKLTVRECVWEPPRSCLVMLCSEVEGDHFMKAQPVGPMRPNTPYFLPVNNRPAQIVRTPLLII
jgi:hypothetical protein